MKFVYHSKGFSIEAETEFEKSMVQCLHCHTFRATSISKMMLSFEDTPLCAPKAKESPAGSPASPVQQLRAEIAAFANELDDYVTKTGRPLSHPYVTGKLRQLSAV